MPTTEKAEKISITLPHEMLAGIKDKVQAGLYGSTSEVIRAAMRLWLQQEEENAARLQLIRKRLDQSVDSGEPVPLEEAFDRIEEVHQRYLGSTKQ